MKYLKITGRQPEGFKLSIVGERGVYTGVDYGGSGLFWASIPITKIQKLITGNQKSIKVKV